MTRITSTVLIMLVLLNGTATIMEASGLSEDIGIQYETGVDDKMQEMISELDGAFEPNINIIESIISLTLAALKIFELVIEGVFVAHPLMINLLGGGAFVETVVTVFIAPLYIISTLELLYLATNADMV